MLREHGLGRARLTMPGHGRPPLAAVHRENGHAGVEGLDGSVDRRLPASLRARWTSEYPGWAPHCEQCRMLPGVRQRVPCRNRFAVPKLPRSIAVSVHPSLVPPRPLPNGRVVVHRLIGAMVTMRRNKQLLLCAQPLRTSSPPLAVNTPCGRRSCSNRARWRAARRGGLTRGGRSILQWSCVGLHAPSSKAGGLPVDVPKAPVPALATPIAKR